MTIDRPPSDAHVDPDDVRGYQQRLELVRRATSDGIWDWDRATDTVYFSPRWKEILGYADDELPNRFDEWEARIHPEDRERALATLEEFLAGDGDSYELEHRLRHRNGSYRWVFARGAAVRDADGVVLRLAGSHTDITDRKLAEAALAEREAQYRSIFETTSDGLVVTDLETGRPIEVNPAFCLMHGYTREELIGASPHLFIHPDSHDLLRQYLETARAGEEFHCQAIDVRKDGSLVDVEVHGAPLTYAGRACVIGVVRDITERVRAYQRLEDRVAERTRELATLLDVAGTVASTLESSTLLGLILDQLKVVVDYTGATLLTLDGRDMVVKETRGASAQAGNAPGLRFPMQRDTPIADAIDWREPVIVDDLRGNSQMAAAYRGAVGELLETPAFSYARSCLAVPMVLNDRITGILSLAHHQPDFYRPQHARLASAIAAHAAVAIENATLYERAQDLAALEERQRLARELHDSVTQSLFSISMISGALPRLLQRDRAQAQERVERLNELAQGALAEMRALIFELRPESLEREGLVAALQKQAAALRARHSLTVDVAECEEPEVPLEVKEALYRIAQEALNNTIKHAHASRLELRLARDDTGVSVEVRDDGVGFVTSAAFPGHLGQQSMRERAARLGGRVDVTSAPGEGTCVRAYIPLGEAGEVDDALATGGALTT
jgi:PAS domain S-box-containing protein